LNFKRLLPHIKSRVTGAFILKASGFEPEELVVVQEFTRFPQGGFEPPQADPEFHSTNCQEVSDQLISTLLIW
jgi:hypothetical protein